MCPDTSAFQRIHGRDRELRVGAAFLDQLTRGPAILHLTGEAGIGKTTLWLGIIRLAAARGFAVLRTRPTATDTAFPYVGLADLVAGSYDGLADRLPRPQRRALDAALLRSAEGSGALDLRAVATGFLTLLGLLAERGPLVVAVDDAEWLDRASLRVLEFAARRLGAMPIGVLVSTRLESETPGFVQAEPDAQVTRLQLAPLSLAALFWIIRDRLGWALARPILLKVEVASRGNPLLALEIARLIETKGPPPLGQPLPVPDRLASLVADKIRALPDVTHEALLTLAAIGRATSGTVDLAALKPAVTAGIVEVRDGRIEFTQPLFAAAAYAQASPAHRAQLHARLADGSSDAVERAYHLARSSTGPDPTIAAALHEAAGEARRRGAPEVAAELEEQAAEFTPAEDRPARWERWLAAADHALHAGDRGRAVALAQRVLGTSPPAELRSRGLRLLGEAMLHDSYAAASCSFEEALAFAQDEAAEATVLLDVAFTEIGRGDFRRAERHAARAIELSEAGDDGPFLAQALAVRTLARFLGTGSLDAPAIDRALRLDDVDGQGALWCRPTLVAGLLHLYTANLAGARRMLSDLHDQMRERGEESDLPFVLVNLAWAEVLAGEHARARASVGEAIEVAELAGSETMRGLALAMRAVIRALDGRPEAEDDARAGLELAKRTGWLVGAAWSSGALGAFALSRGLPEEAARALAPLLGWVEAAGGVVFPTGFFVPDAVEALLGIGEIDRAARLAAAIDVDGRSIGWAWNRALAARCRALVAASRRRLDAALAAADEALDAHASLPVPYELGRTLLIRGEILRRRRQKRAARDAFERALGIFDEIGAELWAARARAELGRVGGRLGEPDRLSATERLVAELAASGLTNREVAARAFLAPKTVESVLERVYVKLGIHSRAELGATMAVRRGDRENGRQSGAVTPLQRRPAAGLVPPDLEPARNADRESPVSSGFSPG